MKKFKVLQKTPKRDKDVKYINSVGKTALTDLFNARLLQTFNL